MTRISEERCDTTLTMRYWIDNCDCGCYPDNLGPCTTWIAGPDGRCPYCAHTIECHAKLATRLDRELRAYRKEGCVAVQRKDIEHLLEYWNGSENERAMSDALKYILGALEGLLAAAPEPQEEP